MATRAELEAEANDPRRFVADGVSVDKHSLPDQIAMDLHLASKAAAESGRKTGLGSLRLGRIAPSGARGMG